MDVLHATMLKAPYKSMQGQILMRVHCGEGYLLELLQ